jgi:hypothetical protein
MGFQRDFLKHFILKLSPANGIPSKNRPLCAKSFLNQQKIFALSFSKNLIHPTPIRNFGFCYFN